MSTEIVDVNGCKRNLVVEVPMEQVNENIDKLARKYAKEVKIPGFRPGKVPMSVVKQRFSSELRSDATKELINLHWKAAVSEHKLRPLSEPVVERVESDPTVPLKFTVSFEVLPSLEVTDYVGVTESVAQPLVEDADIDAELENLREKSAEFVPVEQEEIRDGHLVTLTVDGTIEGGGRPIHEDDVVCVVGGPQTHEAFSENLIGARVGDKRTFNISYPSDYHRPRFAGKQVSYDIVVRDVKEKQLPELNDDFAQDTAGQASLEALRAKIRDDLITKATDDAEKKAREAILGQIAQRQTFDIPECLVEDELKEHAQRIAANLAQQGLDVNKVSVDWKKIFEEQRPHAEQGVRRMLILDAIARQESMTVTEMELEQEFQRLAEESSKSAAAIRAQLEKNDRIQAFKDHLLQKKAFDFVIRNAKLNRG